MQTLIPAAVREIRTSSASSAITASPRDVIAYRRGHVLVLANTQPAPVTIEVSGANISGARDLLSGAIQQSNNIVLGDYGTAVLDLGAN